MAAWLPIAALAAGTVGGTIKGALEGAEQKKQRKWDQFQNIVATPYQPYTGTQNKEPTKVTSSWLKGMLAGLGYGASMAQMTQMAGLGGGGEGAQTDAPDWLPPSEYLQQPT